MVRWDIQRIEVIEVSFNLAIILNRVAEGYEGILKLFAQESDGR